MGTALRVRKAGSEHWEVRVSERENTRRGENSQSELHVWMLFAALSTLQIERKVRGRNALFEMLAAIAVCNNVLPASYRHQTLLPQAAIPHRNRTAWTVPISHTLYSTHTATNPQRRHIPPIRKVNALLLI
jgi:hypothetical protein